MDPELYLAYDGSINADWVARYAIRMSSSTPGRQLTLLHVLDGSIAKDRINSKVKRLHFDSLKFKVKLKVTYLQLEKNVLATLLGAIPWGEQFYCICGARASSRERGFLSGTISQELLRLQKFNTLAVRVVNPGLLGSPVNVMFTLSGHPRKFAASKPIFLMLLPCINKLILLRVMVFSPLLFRYLPVFRVKNALNRGMIYMKDVMAEIHEISGNSSFEMDEYVLISDDWVKEILVQAGKTHAGLILLGASDRLLTSRFYYGNKIEQILRRTPCDVGIYRKV